MNTKNKKADVVIDHQIKILLVAAVVVIALVFIFWKTGFIDYFKNLPDFNNENTPRVIETKKITILGEEREIEFYEDGGYCGLKNSPWGLNLNDKKLEYKDEKWGWDGGKVDKILLTHIPNIWDENKIQDMIWKLSLREELKKAITFWAVDDVEFDSPKPESIWWDEFAGLAVYLGSPGCYARGRATTENYKTSLYWASPSKCSSEGFKTPVTGGNIVWLKKLSTALYVAIISKNVKVSDEEEWPLDVKTTDKYALLVVRPPNDPEQNSRFGVNKAGDLYWYKKDKNEWKNLKNEEGEDYLTLPLGEAYGIITNARLKRDLIKACIEDR
tara:strand:- start:4520 stop:5506 length:987 start_codon:yes stop_codon:yes gene_type:complete